MNECNRCAELERWLQIPGHPDYEVSDHGRFRSWKKPQSRILSQQFAKRGGYPQAVLMTNGRRHLMKAHNAVTAAFIGPRPHGLEVRHIDGDPRNAHIGNLKYGTHAENEADKVTHGTRNRPGTVTRCKHGHEYTPENTYRLPGGKIKYCRACRQLRNFRNRAIDARRARERRAMKKMLVTV